MGASQSSVPSACNYATASTEGEESKRVKPFGLSQNSKYIQLNSSYCMLYDGIVSLIKDNKYADLLIICGDDRYPVHRAIVCPRSKLFEEQCASREGEQDYSSPAKPTKIWIDPSECESHIFAAVLTFLYTLDYSASGQQTLTFGLPEEVGAEEDDHSTLPGEEDTDVEEPTVVGEADIESLTTFTLGDPTPSRSSSRHSSHATNPSGDPSEPQNELVFHAKMCSAGQRFGIRSLCDVAREKMNKRLNSGPWNKEMIGCIREVYRNGGKLSALRETIVKSARARFRILKTCQGWDDLIIEFPEFAAEMLRRL